MSKTITITFYSPKELWEKFWNRFYWPRRKQCAEWCEWGEYVMKQEIISDVLCHDEGLDIDTSVRLELAMKEKIEQVFEQMKTLIETPYSVGIKKK